MPAPTYIAGTAIVVVGIWKKSGGVWTRVTNKNAYAEGVDGPATSPNTPWAIDETVQLGTGIEACGVTVENVVEGSNGVVQDLSSVSWVAQSAGSSQRSATPSGQKAKAKVTPQ